MEVEMPFRSKVIQTCWLFWAFNHSGIYNAILGTSLLDIQLLLDADLSTLSFLFLATGLGTMLGSLTSGIMASRLDLHLQLGVSLLVGVVVLAASLLLRNVVYMHAMFFMVGMTRGFILCYVIQLAARLWEKKGSPFQFLACGSSTGSILTPLVMQPFLCPHPDRPAYARLARHRHANMTAAHRVDNTTTSEPREVRVCHVDDTQVQWGYLTLACLLLPAAVAQIYYWWCYGRAHEDKSPEYKELRREEKTSPKPIKIIFFCILFLVYTLISGLPGTYSSLLMLYGVDGPLHILKSDMLTMTSVFYAGSLISRILNICYTRHFSNFQVIAGHVVGLLACGVAFLTLVSVSSMALWVLSFTIGYFYAPFLCGVMAWISDIMKLNPSITSLCFFASSSGLMVFPFAATLLIDSYGVSTFVYYIFAIIVGLAVGCVCGAAIGKVIESREADEEQRPVISG